MCFCQQSSSKCSSTAGFGWPWVVLTGWLPWCSATDSRDGMDSCLTGLVFEHRGRDSGLHSSLLQFFNLRPSVARRMPGASMMICGPVGSTVRTKIAGYKNYGKLLWFFTYFLSSVPFPLEPLRGSQISYTNGWGYVMLSILGVYRNENSKKAPPGVHFDFFQNFEFTFLPKKKFNWKSYHHFLKFWIFP